MEAKSETLNRLCAPSGVEEEELECPTCQMKLKRCEVAQHCEEETLRLRELQVKEAPQPTANDGERGADRRKPWTVFQRVQRNRQTRLKKSTRKRKPPPVEHPCPVCNDSFSADDIQEHIERCLRRSSGGTSTNGREDSSSNEEDNGDEYEEYEWAGQKRIRVSSLLQGGYAAIGIGQAITSRGSNQAAEEEEEDLNVDEDDTQIYGPPQYGESDVIPSTIERNGTDEESNVTNYMRSLITGTSGSSGSSASGSLLAQLENNNIDIATAELFTSAAISNHNTNVEPSSEAPAAAFGSLLAQLENINNIDIATAELFTSAAISNHNTNVEPSSEAPAAASKSATNHQQIIESLKSQLRHYENHVPSKYKCLICLDDYRNPAISVSCWHVHCEECWLRTLGARKLCPQCNVITTPKDLRRIYM